MSIKRLIGTSLAVRFVTDTGVQIFFPFLAVIALGTDFSIAQVGSLVTIRSLMGLTSPIFGDFGDKYGFRKLMSLGLLLTAIASVLFTFTSGNFGFAILIVAIMGVGNALFIPLLQAYISAQLTWEQRSRGIGILEYAWALSGIIGLAVAGRIIDVFDWRAPFWIIGGLLLCGAFIFLRMPETPKANAAAAAPNTSFFQLGANANSAWAVIVGKFFLMFASMQIYITYGAWLGSEYGLSATQLGRVALLLGIADIIGSGVVSIAGDRMGKRNSMIYSMVLIFVCLCAMPFVGIALIPALAILFVMRNIFEFSIVSTLSLASEQVPAQRGKVMTLVSAASTTGIGLAGITGPFLYQTYGIATLVVPSAISVLISLGLYSYFVNERGE